MEPGEEAEYIFQKLHDEELGSQKIQGDREYPGLAIDGRQAITEMRDAGYPSWKEMEWPTYYIRFLLERLLKDDFTFTREKRRVLFERNYIWDVRVHSALGRGKVQLSDVLNMDAVFNKDKGFGLLILHSVTNLETDEEFRRWQEQITGSVSEYLRHRRRKTYLFLLEGLAFYFPTLESFKVGVREEWLDDKHGKNLLEPGGTERNYKYLLMLRKIPDRLGVAVHDFNAGLDELEEDDWIYFSFFI